MIVPRLLELTSTELGPGQLPADPRSCTISITAIIGPDITGGDNFSFEVATPSALADAQRSEWGRGLFITQAFSWSEVERVVRRLLAGAARESWQEVAQELNKSMLWEFDGYQPYNG
jgi:hypothetical protein